MPDESLLPRGLRGRDFTVAEARAAGLSKNQLRGRAVRRQHRGVYTDPWLTELLANQVAWAVKVIPGKTVAVGTTALRLAGVDLPGGALRLATTSKHPVRRPGLVVSRVASLPPNDGQRALPPYAFAGAAIELGLLELVQAGDHLIKWRLATGDELRAAAAAVERRGKVLARRAAGLVRERVDSPRETWMRLLLVLAGLPEPELNMPTHRDDGVFLGRPDLRWRAFRTTVEYEGDQHRSDRQQWDYDIARYEGFAAAGWTVVRVTAEASRRPRELVMRVHRVLRAGGYRGPDPCFTAEWIALFG